MPSDATIATAGRGVEVRAFLIADVRGYTSYTQAHGDDVASRFAGLVRGRERAQPGARHRAGQNPSPTRQRPALGNGSVWVVDATAGQVLRINPITDGVHRIRLGRALGGIAIGDGRVWVAVPGD